MRSIIDFVLVLEHTARTIALTATCAMTTADGTWPSATAMRTGTVSYTHLTLPTNREV